MSLKKTRNRKCKKDLYKDERNKIISELNTLIGFQEDKNINQIMLYELEENEKLKERLTELSENEIKKYFSYAHWGYYSTDIKKGKNNSIGLFKSLYKNENYTISGKNKSCDHNGIKKLYTELLFINPNFREKI